MPVNRAQADPPQLNHSDSWSASRHVDRRFMLETILCDFHWTTLHIGAVACLTTACASSDVSWTMRPWRHLLQDNAAVMQLGLRYCCDIGISKSTELILSKLYSDNSKAKDALATLMTEKTRYTLMQRRLLLTHSSTWRHLAHTSIVAIKAMSTESDRHVVDRYMQNSLVLTEFLSEVARGDTQRINSWGEISLPTLSQRRRTPRIGAQQPCRIVFADRVIPAIIVDVSRSGLGVAVDERLSAGQSVTIEFDDRRNLTAAVVWSNGARAGLSLPVPLDDGDPLFDGAHEQRTSSRSRAH